MLDIGDEPKGRKEGEFSTGGIDRIYFIMTCLVLGVLSITGNRTGLGLCMT